MKLSSITYKSIGQARKLAKQMGGVAAPATNGEYVVVRYLANRTVGRQYEILGKGGFVQSFGNNNNDRYNAIVAK